MLTASTIVLGCRFGATQQNFLASRLFHGYLSQPLEWHLTRHSAELSESLQRARYLSDNFFRPLVTLLARGVVSLILVGSLLWLDPQVTSWVLLVVVGLFSLTYLVCRHRIKLLAAEESQAGFRLAKTLQDTLSGVRHIQMRASEAGFVRGFSRQLDQVARFSARRIWITEVPRILLHLLANALILGMVIYLEATLRNPETLIPTVSLYALAGYRILPGLQLSLSCLMALHSTRPTLDALWQDLSQLPPDRELPEAPAALVPQRSISLRGCSYAYPSSSVRVLECVALHLNVGQRLAIVGPSGRGKTTLLQILAGMLTPTSGQLLVDDQPLDPVMLRNWRVGIGYVPQEVFLMDDTLLTNLTLEPERPACRERAAEVLRLCAMEDFVPLLDQSLFWMRPPMLWICTLSLLGPNKVERWLRVG